MDRSHGGMEGRAVRGAGRCEHEALAGRWWWWPAADGGSQRREMTGTIAWLGWRTTAMAAEVAERRGQGSG
ncbi:hypothetical protein E2562_019843 [Oryza meyeriana var. granulata]|uniref:Uncharacterized protein n=1 Tax=Oryza meyeriana var. granulata TaxID=110450 RepID=A0A6G1CSQ7_9ORYZ|nr:hypothetical protein E2562_019843 [Oryza meyeriana var. granulata]